MRDTERQAYIEGAILDLQKLLQRVELHEESRLRRRSRHEHARRRLDRWRSGGYGSKSQMVGTTGGGDVSDPVAAAVAAQQRCRDEGTPEERWEWTEDDFERDRAALDEDVETIQLAARRLRKRVVSYTEAPSTKQVPKECRLCDELGHSRPVFADERCEWHWRFRRDWVAGDGNGIDAPRELGRMHLQESKRYVTAGLVRQHVPDARRRTEIDA